MRSGNPEAMVCLDLFRSCCYGCGGEDNPQNSSADFHHRSLQKGTLNKKSEAINLFAHFKRRVNTSLNNGTVSKEWS
jgi:hypothetical protein